MPVLVFMAQGVWKKGYLGEAERVRRLLCADGVCDTGMGVGVRAQQE